MHDITFIRENPDLFDELLKKRFIDPKSNEIISLDKKKRDIYYCRLSGIFNSMIGKKSWYRPSLD